ncbi:MAG TPA: SIS domain-containing protein [Oligoflexia bacterium]|nr:SIS domain-containing protein [Oligoflexia bacterium]
MKRKQPYIAAIEELIRTLSRKNELAVKKVVGRLARSIDNGGLLYVFGSGHSAILVEEVFHRAGGLVPVYPILTTVLTPHTTPKISGPLERLSGIAAILFKKAAPTSKDILFIASNSGVNAAAIEMALEAKKNKVWTVAFTSVEHSKAAATRHSSGKRLKDIVDVVLDNCAPVGDATVDFGETKVGAVSTIANSILYHWILTDMCARWKRAGKKLPVYRSANLPGGDEYNERQEKKVRKRIPLL